jgi:hypothetical protein
MATTVSKLLNTGVLQTAGDIDEFTLDSLNQGSVFFNGSSSYLTVPTSSFITATNTYTIEMWLNPTVYPTTTNSAVLYQVTNANITNYGGLSVELYASTGNIRFQCRPSTGGTNVTITTTASIPLGVWTHVAVVVNNGYAIIYLNGVQSGANIVTALDNTQTFCSIGYLNNGNITSQAYYTGYMSNLRVTKGIAIYPDNAALTTTSGLNFNTSLLAAQSSSIVTDASSTYPIINNVAGILAANTNIPFVGTYSSIFNGTNQYLTNLSNSISNFGTDNFTFECWINSNNTGITGTIYDARPTYGEDYALTVFQDNTAHITVYVAGATVYSSSIVIFPSVWYHIAVVRSGIGTNQCSLYINGILDGSFTLSTNLVNAYNNIGSSSYTSGTNFFNGLISNLRIVKGTALYSGSSFTVPTTPLTAISGTSLLTCYSSDPTSVLVSNSIAPTPMSNPSPITTSSSVIPFAGTYSTVFDGGSQYLQIASTTISNFGTGNFTFECWLYKTLNNDYSTIYDGGAQDGSGNYFYIGYNNSAFGQYEIGINGTAIYTSPARGAENQWVHIAVVRSGTGTNQTSFYVNGVLNGTFTCAQNIVNGYNGIGNFNSGAKNGGSFSAKYFGGYLSNLRIVKGTAVYSGSSFTVPTTPLTAISGTSLLTCQSSSPTFDVANNNTFISFPTLVNSTSSSVIPFAGTYSTVFNGTNYITAQKYVIPEFTANFTIELWVRFNNFFATGIQQATTLIGNSLNINGIGPNLSVYAWTTPVLQYASTPYSSVNITGTTTLVTNTWYHIAIVRNGSTTTLYLNGNVEGSFSDSQNYVGNAPLYFGVNGNVNYYTLDAYISNFRIVKGVAVYTSAFPSSIPTTALTAISGTSLLAFNSSSPNTYTTNDTSSSTNLPAGLLTTSNSVIPFASTYSIVTTNNAPMSVIDNLGLQLPTGNFTIEFWMRPTSLTLSGLFCKKIGTNTTSWAGFAMYLQATGRLAVQAAAATSTAWTINDTTSMPVMTINTWYHVALVRNGNNIQAYVNGTQYINSTAIASGTTVFESNQPFLIGRNFPTSTSFTGYISNFRVVKGIAVYTGAFTPPTTPLTTTQSSGTNIAAISSGLTTLLVAQSASAITDNALNNTSYIGNVGTVTTSTSVIPFAGTYSNLFNGSTQYLSLPASDFLPQINNTYTIEMWINPSAYPTSTNYCSLFQVSNSNVTNFGNLNLEFYGTGIIRFEVKPNTGGTLVTIATTAIVPLGQWTHVAVNVDRGRATIYLNGTASAYGIVSPLDGTQTYSSIGRLNNGFVTSQVYYNGYISNVRVVRGKAIYSNLFYAFDVPSTQLQTTQSSSTGISAIPSASSVGLLLPLTQSTDDSSTYGLTITKSFSAPSTVIRIKPPFIDFNAANDGYNSVYFPGLNNGVTSPLTATTAGSLDFANLDFTVECWVYLQNDNGRKLKTKANGSSQYNIVTLDSATGTNIIIYMTSDTLALSSYGNDVAIFVPYGGSYGNTNFQYNTWYHIAITRSGALHRAFINGIEASIYSGTFTTSTNFTTSGVMFGCDVYRTVYNTFCGYISNFRAVKNKVLYTSNFTPSTTPLKIVVGTSLLTCQSNIFKDNSGRQLNKDFVSSGTLISKFNPFSDPTNITVNKQYSNGVFQTTNNIDEITLNSNLNNQGSILLNNIPYITTYTNEIGNFNLTSDFTIEAWLFNNDTVNTNERYFFQTSASSTTSSQYYAGGIKNGQHTFYDGTGATQYYAGTAPLGRWYHYALVRKNNILQLFIDGTLLYFTSDTVSTGASRYFTIGEGVGTGSAWKGYISNLRVVKDIAVYSKSMSYLPKKITVPSTALTTTSITTPSTSLLTAQSSTIIDNSGRGIEIFNSNVTTTNSVIPFSATYSYFFNNTTTVPYLTIQPQQYAFDFKSLDWTFECWLYPTSYDSGESVIFTKTDPTSTWIVGAYRFSFNNTGRLIFRYYGASLYDVTATSTTLTLNAWNHVAFVRSGGIVYIYLNGTRDATTGSSSIFGSFTSTTSDITIGVNQDKSTLRYFGYMSNLRLAKGIAVYSGASFTVPTSALPPTTPTSNLTEILTAQSSTIVDNSTNNIVLNNEPAGIPTITNSIIPFAGTYSTKFNGHNNGLFQNSAYTAFGTGDFTIEAWVYFDGGRPLRLSTDTGGISSPTDFQGIISSGSDSSTISSNGLQIGVSADLIQCYRANNGRGYVFIPSGGAVGTSYFQYNTWYHLAYTRASGTHRFFINGVAATAQASPAGVNTTFAFTNLGLGYNTPQNISMANPTSYTSNYCFSGYLSNVRVVSGQALYTSGFTPATSALTKTSQGATASNVVLLTCQDATYKDNSNRNDDIWPVGNITNAPSASQLVKKPYNTLTNTPFAGTYSTKFNGANYLYANAGSDWAFGTGDFTVECWVWLWQTVSGANIFGPWSSSSAYGNFALCCGSNFASTNLAFRISIGSSDNTAYNYLFERSGSGGLVNSSWTHIVATRSSGVIRIFSNGVLINNISGSQAAVNVAGTTQPMIIGGGVNNTLPSVTMNNAIDGYISNVRVVKGQVVPSYATSSTTNGATIFTPPTSPLTTTSQGVTASNVVLLTCQDPTFIDNGNGNSGSKYTINPAPSVITSNSIIPFAGTNSYYFYGSGSYLQSEPSDALKFGTDDFAIEFWAYPTATPSVYGPMVVINSPYASGVAQTIRISSNELGFGIGFRIPSGIVADSNYYPITDYFRNLGTYTMPLNTWSHILLTRKNGVIKLYYNGACVYIVPHTATPFDFGSVMAGSPTTYIASTTPCLRLGYDPASPSDGYFVGYLSNIRIVNGASVYDVSYSGGNFTSPSSALTITQSSGTNIAAIANNETTFLLSSGINGYEDIAPAKNPLIKNGTVITTYQSPFNTASPTSYYSGKFNGVNNYVNVSGTTLAAIGTADFTIECFINLTATAVTNYSIYDGRPSGTANAVYPTLFVNTNIPYYYVSGANRITGTTLSLYTWYHIAIVKISSVTKMYINGVQVGAAYADSNSYLATTGRPVIGADLSLAAGFFPGYISNLRVAVGVGVYTGPFIPPTSTLQTTQTVNGHIAAITGVQTKLLAFTTSNILTDASGINTLVNTGSVLSANATEPPLLLFPPSTAPTVSANTTLMKQYKNGELKVINYIDEYNIRLPTITPDILSLNELSTVTFSIFYPQFGSGTMYWTNAGSTVGSDFSDSNNSGSITITNGIGTLTRTLANDQIVEGTETIIIQLRTGSISGPIIATSSTVVVNDIYAGQAVASYPTTVSGTNMVNTGTGTFNWTCPAGVTSISVVCVGGGGCGGPNGGGGGGGGGLAYINNYTVVPGNVYAVVTGVGGIYSSGTGTSGGSSYFINTSTVAAGGGGLGGYSPSTGGAGGTVLAGTGFAGGAGGLGGATYSGAGGGGAGGYTAIGGGGGTGYLNAGQVATVGASSGGSGGGGGGGGGSGAGTGGGGGGVGLLGAGSNGIGGSIGTNAGFGGTGGSGGTSGGQGTGGSSNPVGPATGNYGGGGGGADGNSNVGGNGGVGAVRIIWGSGRSYPFTNTGDV